MQKQKILIVDDSEINRILLRDILEDQYEITEAENGAQAVEILAQSDTDFWFVLLDIMMPEMDGFDVLNYINKHYWNDRVVVMMISSDDSAEKINRAYSLGAFDYIGRPFDPMIVSKRIANTLALYARQNDLEKAVEEQFYEQQKNNDLMISILSHIVEFRNGESGLHIQNVKAITKLLLIQLAQVTDKYPLSKEEIDLISMASAIHDVGKISIPEEILNKPGRLTAQEFELMKTHAEIGSKMMSDLPIDQFNSPLAKISYEICRWHHERYDGCGYPDGLKGDETPIAAQVVAMADVYDALTSDRCYKKAFSHEEALRMIMEGKCGAFNPILLQCLNEVAARLKKTRPNSGWKLEAEKERERQIKTEQAGMVGQNNQEVLSAQPEYMKLLYIDPMMNVYNRRYYKEFIQSGADVKAVALIDMDNIKQINDDYGREVGDRVLQRAAQLLSSRIRKSDYLIRYGGDEFWIGSRNITRSAFEQRLEEIRKSFEELTIEGYPQLYVTVSIGGVYGAQGPETSFDMANELLSQAQISKNKVVLRFLDDKTDDI